MAKISTIQAILFIVVIMDFNVNNVFLDTELTNEVNIDPFLDSQHS